jgi:cytochrome P450 PksS
MTQFFGGASSDLLRDAEKADSGAYELNRYFSELIRSRRENPADDFISHLVKNQALMDDAELISQAAIMLVAGTVTTTDQICNNLHQFLQSGMWARLVKEPELLESAIEEATRLEPAVNFIFRIAKEDLPGTEIKKGQLIFVSTQAANRDEKIFPQADQFEMRRERNPHLSYGHGAHYCLGAKLGRIQTKELFKAMLFQFPDLQLCSAKAAVRKHESLGFSGFETLFIEKRH